MRIFTKLIFIWNCCFIVSVVLRYIESVRIKTGNNNALIPLPVLEGSLVLLGYTAIFANLVYFIIALLARITRKSWPSPRALCWFNIILLVVQIYYFIFFK
jgi:hypothetical protein